MLLELEIENFALIRRLQLHFGDGLNVLTGETGAGKSIVLDALGFLSGGAPRDVGARNGSRVAGVFRSNPEAGAWLEEQGFGCDSNEILVARELTAAGRSSSRINSRLCTLAQLQELSEMLVEIHGQHQGTSLQRPSKHLELLDRLAGEAHQRMLAEYRQAWRKEQQLRASLEELRSRERDRNRELEWLRHELAEIESARLRPEEGVELEARLKRLQSAEEIRNRSLQAVHYLGGDGGAEEALAQATKQVSSLLRLTGQDLVNIVARLEEASLLVRDCLDELDRYVGEASGDPGAVDELVARQEQIKALQRKYGPDVPAILEYAARGRERLSELEGSEERAQEMERELSACVSRREELARSLSATRTAAARVLEERTAAELAELNLKSMRFVVQHSIGEPGPTGIDQFEYYLSANPGVEPRPLAKVASGGELSRIMLALISLLAALDPYPTLIFDEIDAGLGGRAAEAVARKLAQLAVSRQVLGVTHLAVIAAAGNHHLRVLKETDGTSTTVAVETLSGAARQEEIARMLSGDASPEAALRHAEQLLGNGIASSKSAG